MTRKRPSLPAFLVFCLAAANALPSQSWNAALPETLDGMTRGYWQPSVQAAFGTFTYAYTELSSPFARWLEEGIADAIAKSRNLKLFNRAAAAAMDPDFKAIYGEYFRSNGVDGLIHGRYFDEGDYVRARLELTGLGDGNLIGTTELRIPKRALPSGLAVDPSAAATETASRLAQVLPAPATPAGGGTAPAAGDLRVSVSTERGPGAVYREGEDLVVLVTANREVYLKVYHVDVKGTVQLIWPNRFGGAGTLKPGVVMRIPGSGDGFSFRMTPPFGTEFIKVLASTRPFAANEADFSPLGSDARGTIYRGLAVLGQPSGPASNAASAEASAMAGAMMAEAMASYVIMEAAP